MAALAQSSNHTMSASSLMHAQIDALTSSASAPLHLEEHRERFQERALRDVTVNSNDPAMLLEPNNPLLVGEEMAAQKDYFRRLKFSYLEQESKRNFLFSITGDDPQAVQPGENEALEASNAEKKAELKAMKAELENMRVEAIQMAKKNAARHTTIRAEVAEVADLQKQIRDAELELARIKATHPVENRMTTDQANLILDEQINEIQRLTDEIGSTGSKVEETRDEVTKTAKEIARLSREREREEARAKEVREGREAGDGKVDELCRWLSSSIHFYRTLLGIKSVSASAQANYTLHLLHIVYDTPPAGGLSGEKGEVELVLKFDASSKRLVDAELNGSDLNIAEAVGMAKESNDVPGLVGVLLNRLRPIPAV